MSNQLALNTYLYSCSERKKIDLDFLNIVASGTIPGLCICSYRQEDHRHCLTYQTDAMASIAHGRPLQADEWLGLLSNFLELIHAFSSASCSIGSIKLTKECIFRGENRFYFIALPTVQAHPASAREVLIKLVSLIPCRDLRRKQLLQALRKTKTAEQSMACLEQFLRTHYRADPSAATSSPAPEEGETTLLSGESETTLLSGEAETSLLSTEAETTLLSAEAETPLLSDEAETSLLSAEVSAAAPSDEAETSLLGGIFDCVEAPRMDAGQLADAQAVFSREPDLSELCDEPAWDSLTMQIPNLSSECETTLLSAVMEDAFSSLMPMRSSEQECTLFLMRLSTGEIIPVNTSPFTIGKEEAHCDYILRSASVSRRHATIFLEDGKHWIMDDHSTNGTIVEGIRLQPDERVPLEPGFIIMLGNETFQALEESGE